MNYTRSIMGMMREISITATSSEFLSVCMSFDINTELYQAKERKEKKKLTPVNTVMPSLPFVPLIGYDSRHRCQIPLTLNFGKNSTFKNTTKIYDGSVLIVFANKSL